MQLVRELNVPDNWEREHEDEDHVAWLTHETVQVRVQMCRQKMSVWTVASLMHSGSTGAIRAGAVEWVGVPLRMAQLSVTVMAFGPKWRQTSDS
jgi:hypothetical protein